MMCLEFFVCSFVFVCLFSSPFYFRQGPTEAQLFEILFRGHLNESGICKKMTLI